MYVNIKCPQSLHFTQTSTGVNPAHGLTFPGHPGRPAAYLCPITDIPSTRTAARPCYPVPRMDFAELERLVLRILFEDLKRTSLNSSILVYSYVIFSLISTI